MSCPYNREGRRVVAAGAATTAEAVPTVVNHSSSCASRSANSSRSSESSRSRSGRGRSRMMRGAPPSALAAGIAAGRPKRYSSSFSQTRALTLSPLAPSPFSSPQATSTGSCSAKTASASARASSLARPRHFSAGPLFRAFFALLETLERELPLRARGPEASGPPWRDTRAFFCFRERPASEGLAMVAAGRPRLLPLPLPRRTHRGGVRSKGISPSRSASAAIASALKWGGADKVGHPSHAQGWQLVRLCGTPGGLKRQHFCRPLRRAAALCPSGADRSGSPLNLILAGIEREVGLPLRESSASRIAVDAEGIRRPPEDQFSIYARGHGAAAGRTAVPCRAVLLIERGGRRHAGILMNRNFPRHRRAEVERHGRSAARCVHGVVTLNPQVPRVADIGCGVPGIRRGAGDAIQRNGRGSPARARNQQAVVEHCAGEADAWRRAGSAGVGTLHKSRRRRPALREKRAQQESSGGSLRQAQDAFTNGVPSLPRGSQSRSKW